MRAWLSHTRRNAVTDKCVGVRIDVGVAGKEQVSDLGNKLGALGKDAQGAGTSAAQPGQAGSSPRPWGTRPSQAGNGQAFRFIPTPVGNTAAAISRRPRGSVHPHARGEHLVSG